MRSQRDMANGHDPAFWLDIDVTVWRGLHGADEGLPGDAAFQAAKFFGGDDDDCIAPVYRDVLRPLAPHLADEFAEARLGVLQKPVAPGRRSTRRRVLIMSAMADMIQISFTADMYFTEDMLYSVRHEGHNIAQRRTAWCCYSLEA